jgi:hypothetical protein
MPYERCRFCKVVKHKASIVPPAGIHQPGTTVSDPAERLIRRARRAGKQRYVHDQISGKVRPPAAAFEPRLPQNRPNAARHDEYLSVNIASSLAAVGMPLYWRGNTEEFYSAILPVAVCHEVSLTVTWEPDVGCQDASEDNPHHGAIRSIVELFYLHRDAYEAALTRLAKGSEVLPECLGHSW